MMSPQFKVAYKHPYIFSTRCNLIEGVSSSRSSTPCRKDTSKVDRNTQGGNMLDIIYAMRIRMNDSLQMERWAEPIYSGRLEN